MGARSLLYSVGSWGITSRPALFPGSALLPGSAMGGALQIVAASRFAEELAAIHDDLAAREHGARVAGDFVAFEHGVIDAHVMSGGADGVERGGVPDDEVGVAAGGDFALAGIHAEDARRGSGGEFHEAIERELALVDAVVIHELQAVFDAGAAVGNLGEIVLAERLLVGETEGAVVGRDHLKVIVLEPLPEFRQVMFGTQGRGEDVFGALEILSLIHISEPTRLGI